MAIFHNVGAAVTAFADNLLAQSQKLFDSLFPPEKRATFIENLHAWASANPKLAVRCLLLLTSLKRCIAD